METIALDFLDKYGIFFYAGIFSTLAFIVSKRSKGIKLLNYFIQATFVAVLIGILARNYTDFVNEVIFVVAAIGGYFALDILGELRELVGMLSEAIQYFVKKRFGFSSKRNRNNDEEDIEVDENEDL